ncbi:Increased rDNA silencing protein [Didymella pomorum]|uniref:Increased rDNA silencing protein n=1 Tax=Didymella pomorum TaxID=749634 RepID=A0A9W9D217_9PLEO|nr:Increased rDNA silencing protein [Didymella pomorum]
MRKEPSPPSSSDDEIDFKRKGNRMLGMKHHEGTRKRWRDAITERERKRYEGVWAANKGILIPNSARRGSGYEDDDPGQDVANLVVREIWNRSRLPEHVLEEVWALVDGREVGRLTRVEFVVGLWLVDQRLKGRKLPTRVSDSVWTSARGLGIKVKVRT